MEKGEARGGLAELRSPQGRQQEAGTPATEPRGGPGTGRTSVSKHKCQINRRASKLDTIPPRDWRAGVWGGARWPRGTRQTGATAGAEG